MENLEKDREIVFNLLDSNEQKKLKEYYADFDKVKELKSIENKKKKDNI